MPREKNRSLFLRLSDEDYDLIEELASQMGDISRQDVVRVAVAELADRRAS